MIKGWRGGGVKGEMGKGGEEKGRSAKPQLLKKSAYGRQCVMFLAS